jgi:hypothetical protein
MLGAGKILSVDPSIVALQSSTLITAFWIIEKETFVSTISGPYTK